MLIKKITEMVRITLLAYLLLFNYKKEKEKRIPMGLYSWHALSFAVL